MPTPMGHAIAGLAAAFIVESAARRPHLSPGLLIASAAVAVAPDLDLLIGSHRTYTHSLGAVFIVGAASWFLARSRVPGAMRAAAILTAAYGSHLILDWMGKDTSIPPGLTIAWPFSSAYYVSGWNLFGEVSRRYWLPREFVLGNLQALAWEMMVLVPLFLIAWVIWSKRTLAR
ncbi:MAG: metal-dependent hydrolase [Vicinamibacterales bacterium]